MRRLLMIKNGMQLLLCALAVMSSTTFGAYAEQSLFVVKKGFTHSEVKKIVATAMIIPGGVIVVVGILGLNVPMVALGAALIIGGVVVGHDRRISLVNEWKEIPSQAVIIATEGFNLGKRLLILEENN